MGDKRRFDLFARFIADRVPASDRAAIRVADVAAGKGTLSFALRALGFRNVVPFEPAPRRGGQITRLGIRVHDFMPRHADGFDLIVGMHPDGATDCIFEGAARVGAMAIVCPCCVRPNVWTYWGSKQSHPDWHAHLKVSAAGRGLILREDRLRMDGANVVLWGTIAARTNAKTPPSRGG